MAKIICSLLMEGGLNSETFLQICGDQKSLRLHGNFSKILYGYSENNSTFINCVKVAIMVEKKLWCLYPSRSKAGR